MKKVVISGAVVLVVVLIVGLGQLFQKSNEIVQMGTAESLLNVRSQVEKALPGGYPGENVMAEFDATLEKMRAGQVDAGELIQHLKRISAGLQDGKLDSVEVDSVIIGFHKIIATKQLFGWKSDHANGSNY